MAGYCLFTNDVETTSIVNGGLRDETGLLVLQQGMPRLLELYAKHKVKATFFFTAYIAELYPEIVRMILPYGHEVASHGYTHDFNKAFDVLTLEEQITHLVNAKRILEDISGTEVLSFRAPALRVNEKTVEALQKSGYKYDSSIAPQRLDMFMTLGSKNKLNWIKAPRGSYFTSQSNLARRGDSSIVEVPVSSLVFPYIGTFMRISPCLNSLTRDLLYYETRNTSKAVNFLIHPNELIDEEKKADSVERRAKSYLSYLLADLLRNYLKQKNLGLNAMYLLEKEILFWKKREYDCISIKDYIEKINL